MRVGRPEQVRRGLGDVVRLGAALLDHYVAHGSMTKESAHDGPTPAAFLASTQTE